MADEQEQKQPAMPDLESVYDGQIYPLMDQIIRICKEHRMPFVACFQYSGDGFCTSSFITPESNQRLPMAQQLLRHGFTAFVTRTIPGPAGGVVN